MKNYNDNIFLMKKAFLSHSEKLQMYTLSQNVIWVLVNTHKHIILKDVDSNYYWVVWIDEANCSKWNHTFARRRNEKNQQKLVLRALSLSLPRLIEIRCVKEKEKTWYCFSTRVFLRFFSIIIKTPHHPQQRIYETCDWFVDRISVRN